MDALTDFATVGAAYSAHSLSARGRLRHDLVARRLLAELPARPARVLVAQRGGRSGARAGGGDGGGVADAGGGTG
ncbi:hypothetical protein PV371_16240 [Streptomyces sp. TX20-6-3]|uniref:hypothetical protein n=1 Tax=Streptomyces sp. TX20-6-3 TaxID=3028705 RepID=UPI0029B2318F|nr:hypothetical protein [Streptomyces sp. TX20-6-3]MDX2561201.1 hypothetical protein [Streptomyces sp. TX20-6-3]